MVQLSADAKRGASLKGARCRTTEFQLTPDVHFSAVSTVFLDVMDDYGSLRFEVDD